MTGGKPNTQAQFLYNGTGYGSAHGAAAVDSDCDQSDFKTTTLRFTNNNFINNDRRERDSSTGAVNP